MNNSLRPAGPGYMANMKMGTLYGVGVGPGDPELITLKAARIIRAVPVVVAPISQPDGESHALHTVAGLLQPGQMVEKLLFPMVKELATRERYRAAASQTVVDRLRMGDDVAFLTEGDPLIHSTFIYVLRLLPEGMPVEIVPGVSSISAAAAEAQWPLINAGQRLALLPATFEDVTQLPVIARDFDTIVLLKVHSTLDRWVDALVDAGLADQAVLVECASLTAARVVRNVRTLRGTQVHYLSLLIVRTRRQ
ncbi:MAG: precorrin-2 C(20)-methyltransferase [Chloroflexi bacterium]|nr:precorrin-2 C(20)-methyltransferase [Chloroflexota bacterium]